MKNRRKQKQMANERGLYEMSVLCVWPEFFFFKTDAIRDETKGNGNYYERLYLLHGYFLIINFISNGIRYGRYFLLVVLLFRAHLKRLSFCVCRE